MLYLTGAASSLAKSWDSAQNDVDKSLGGYISSSPVPNGSINALFDIVSLNTLKNKTKEVIAIALINKFDFNVSNVRVKIVTRPDFIGKFKLAAVSVGDDYCMEHIDNRYSEPIHADFHDVDFYKAFAKCEIKNPCVPDEAIFFTPFNVTAVVQTGGIEGTMNAILEAFSTSEDYSVRRLSEKDFIIVSKDENVVEPSLECEAICTESGEIIFDGNFGNVKNNEALVADVLEPGKAIGFWLQREVIHNKKTNEEVIQDYNNKTAIDKFEEVEFVIDYDVEASE